MDNKKLGVILVISAVVLLVLLVVIRSLVVGAYEREIAQNEAELGVCHAEYDTCPHEQLLSAQVPIFIAIAMILGVIALGGYLIFFEKSQKEIVSTLKKERAVQTADEKFKLLLLGLDADEKKVISAVREQDGITQQTLRLRTDLHKSKLSILLDGLEKKGLVKRVAKGKTKQVHLKVHL